jgi:hypothetical protein
MGQKAGEKWAGAVAHCQRMQPVIPKSDRLQARYVRQQTDDKDCPS